MAKNRWTITGVILCAVAILSLGGGALLYAFNAKDTADDAETAVVTLKAEGCTQADDNEKAIIGMQKDIESIKENVAEIRTEQAPMRNDLTYIRAKMENE